MRTGPANLLDNPAVRTLVRDRPDLERSIAALQSTIADGKLEGSEVIGTVLPTLISELGKDSYGVLVDALRQSGVTVDPPAQQAFLDVARLSRTFELGAPEPPAVPQRVLDGMKVAQSYLGRSIESLLAGHPMIESRQGDAGAVVELFQTPAGTLRRERFEQATSQPRQKLVLPGDVELIAVAPRTGVGQYGEMGPIVSVSIGPDRFDDTRNDGTVGQRKWSTEGRLVFEDLDAHGEVTDRTDF